MTSDLAEAEVVDSSDNFSQAAHRLCVSEPGSDVAPRHSRAGTISFKKCVSYFAFTYTTGGDNFPHVGILVANL